jgi:hypothetical protein
MPEAFLLRAHEVIVSASLIGRANGAWAGALGHGVRS